MRCVYDDLLAVMCVPRALVASALEKSSRLTVMSHYARANMWEKAVLV